jgi:hypothetical protein
MSRAALFIELSGGAWPAGVEPLAAHWLGARIRDGFGVEDGTPRAGELRAVLGCVVVAAAAAAAAALPPLMVAIGMVERLPRGDDNGNVVRNSWDMGCGTTPRSG